MGSRRGRFHQRWRPELIHTTMPIDPPAGFESKLGEQWEEIEAKHPYLRYPAVFATDEAGRYEPLRTAKTGLGSIDARGLAALDVDGTGRLDLVVANAEPGSIEHDAARIPTLCKPISRRIVDPGRSGTEGLTDRRYDRVSSTFETYPDECLSFADPFFIPELANPALWRRDRRFRRHYGPMARWDRAHARSGEYQPANHRS